MSPRASSQSNAQTSPNPPAPHSGRPLYTQPTLSTLDSHVTASLSDFRHRDTRRPRAHPPKCCLSAGRLGIPMCRHPPTDLRLSLSTQSQHTQSDPTKSSEGGRRATTGLLLAVRDPPPARAARRSIADNACSPLQPAHAHGACARRMRPTSIMFMCIVLARLCALLTGRLMSSDRHVATRPAATGLTPAAESTMPRVHPPK